MTTRIQPWTEPQLLDRESVFEALVEKAVFRTMRKVGSEAREGILTAAPTLPVDPATAGAYSTLEGAVMAEWTQQVDASLYPFLTQTFGDSASRVVDGIAEASGVVVDPLTGDYADEALRYAYNRMVGIGETLWLSIRDQLVEGYNAGEGIPEIAERLTQVAGISMPRALTVARTEIISAANNGSYLQMLNAGFEEAVTKVWLATEDTRTRLSHRHADNQGVELTGEFNVDIYSGDVKTGTEPMEFPGDPTATPGNIINCRCSLAFDFDEDEEEVLVAAADFQEKEHPRDKDGKFKKKGAPDLYIKVPDKKNPPAANSPDAVKVAWIATHKWDSMAAGQKAVLIKSITEPTWEKLDPALKAKIKDAPNQTSHPEAKKVLENAVEKLDGFNDTPLNAKQAIEKAVSEATTGKRALGGTDTKTGKPLVPGKPTKLRVQLLYNTTFEDGAIMAVRKDSDERIVWDEKNKKINRQKLSASGKYETTEALSRGAAYAAWKDEDGWTVPDASGFAAPAPTPDAEVPPVALGKSTSLKVQLIYQTPFDDGDIVAVNPTTGEVIHWDAKKKRMVVTSELGTTEYTRGALYKEFKDEKGWHLPADKKAALTTPKPAKKAAPAAAPAPVAEAVPTAPAVPSVNVPEIDPATGKYKKAVLQQATFNGKTVSVTSKTPWTHMAVVAYPDNPAGGLWSWHKSEEAASKPTLTGTQKKNGWHWVATVPVVIGGQDAAPVPDTFGAEPVSTYTASDASNAIFQAWDNGIPGEIHKEGKISVGLAKSGNLIFLDATPDGGVGVVKAADVNSENIDKALAAVNAGKSWTVDDAIPEADPDEISAPGGSEDVSAGQSTSLVPSGLTESKLEDVYDSMDSALIDDILYEDDSVTITKVSNNYVEVFDKKSGKSFSDKTTNITLEHIDDFKELNAPDAVPTVSGPINQSLTDEIIQKTNDASLFPLSTVWEEGNVQIIKGGNGSIGVSVVDKGFITLAPDEITPEKINQAIIDAQGGVTNFSPGASISTNIVTDNTAANLQAWAKNPSIFSGEELFNSVTPSFKIFKVSPGMIVVYAKDSNGDVIPTSGQTLIGDEITSQGLQNTLSQMGLTGAGVTAPTAPSAPAVDTTPVGGIPSASSLKATGQTLGTHGGQLYKDPEGSTWLFKPSTPSQKHLALAEIAAGKLHEKAGLVTPEMGGITIGGKFGAIQKIIPNTTSPYEGSFNAKTVTGQQVLQLQKEHIFDWLVSNHDSNGSNILKDADGKLIGIDKGQAYKFFGADTLDPSFNPNGHAVPITNQLFQQYIKAPLSVDISPKSTLNSFIDKLQSIPDDEFRAILRPYAEAAAANGTLAKGGPSYLGLSTVPFPANDVEAFLDAAVARKNSLDHTFTEFYKKLDKAADGETVDWKISKPPAVASPVNPPTVTTMTVTQKPIKLSHGVLVGKTSQGYKDGQVIAEHPATGERLVWNAKTKKYSVQLQETNGNWTTAYSYNKTAAYNNLKDDSGWVTPSVVQTLDAGSSAGDPALAPNIAGAPQVHTLPPKVAAPAAIAVPKPKISVADLQAQADISTVILPATAKSALWTNFRTKGIGGSSTVTLSSEPKDIFQGLLIAQAMHNKANPSAKLSLFQVLRLMDVTGTEKSPSSVNQNLYEKKIVEWLQTPTGLATAQQVSDTTSVGGIGTPTIDNYNKVLEKFKEHHAKSFSPTAGWTAAMAALPPHTVKAHTPGQTYPEITTTSQGNKFGANMIAKYGPIPADSKSALRAYTGNDYGAMNAYMRSFGKSNSGQATKAKEANIGLRPSPQALTVHRNSNTVFDESWTPTLAQLQDFKGVVFTEDAFASTSNDGHTFNSKNYRFIIEVPEGTPIAWVDEFSQNKGETEFVLGPGLKYEILEITGPGTGSGASTAHKTAVIRMRVVP